MSRDDRYDDGVTYRYRGDDPGGPTGGDREDEGRPAGGCRLASFHTLHQEGKLEFIAQVLARSGGLDAELQILGVSRARLHSWYVRVPCGSTAKLRVCTVCAELPELPELFGWVARVLQGSPAAAGQLPTNMQSWSAPPTTSENGGGYPSRGRGRGVHAFPGFAGRTRGFPATEEWTWTRTRKWTAGS
jgi:hypothetical protein